MTDSAPLTGPEAVASRIGRAGGIIASRDGKPIILNYGSVAGELAVCRSRVGIAVRTELSVAEVSGDENRLDELMRTFVDDLGPYLNRTAVADGLLWSRSALRHLVAISDGPPAELRTAVRSIAARSIDPPRIAIGHLTAFSVIGPRAADLLARVTGPVPGASESVAASCAGHPVVVIRDSGDRFLLLAPETRAYTVLTALLGIGDALGASLIGMEAVRLNAAGHRAVPTPC